MRRTVPSSQQLTALLAAHREGDDSAFEGAFAAVYEELRRIAHSQRRSRTDSTLDTTAIVHEGYLKLLGSAAGDWQNRGHFMAVAASAMRQVAIDYARSRSRIKRGGQAHHVDLAESTPAQERQVDQILAVHRALERIGEHHPRLVQVVECRYFAGLTENETAAALQLSVTSVQRAWRAAKERLRRELTDRPAIREPRSGHGTVTDQREVSPLSKPSWKSGTDPSS